jgi:hypothetical protein
MGWIAGLGALAGGVISSMGSSSSAKSTADANARATADTNATNERLFHEGRGAGGYAVLPEYMGDAETTLGRNAADVARSLFNYNGGPQARLQATGNLLRRYNPAMDAGDGLVIDLSTGKVSADRKASLAPVLAARTNAAKSRTQAINDSLNETLAGLRSARATSGFRGNSTFDINRTLAATTGARTQAADAMSQAMLENALATQGIDESNLQLRLKSLDLPYTRAQQRIAFNGLPLRSAADDYSAALAPLNFFRLPNANPPQQQPFLRSDIPGTSQILGSALYGTSQGIGQNLAQQQMLREMAKYYYGGGGGGGGSFDAGTVNPGTYGDSPYW